MDIPNLENNTWIFTCDVFFTLHSSSRNKNDDDDGANIEDKFPNHESLNWNLFGDIPFLFEWKRFVTHFSGLYNSKDIQRNK